MEMLARKKAEQRADELQARIEVIEQRPQQDRASEEPISQHGSTSRHHEIGHAELDQDDEGSASGDDNCCDEEDQNFNSQVETVTQPRPEARTNDSRSEHDALVGKDVILYALLRPDRPVAKGTIVTVKPSAVLAGKALGREFCEVIVTCVLKRDEILPRPYADVETMADAHKMSIAWPYKKLKINKAQPPPASGVGR